MTVFRGDLEPALYDAVRDRADIRFGTTVSPVDQDVDRVRMSSATAPRRRPTCWSAPTGCTRPPVRRCSGPAFRVDLPYVVVAFPLAHPMPDVPESSATTFIGPGRTAAIVNLGPGRSSAFFTYRCADPGRPNWNADRWTRSGRRSGTWRGRARGDRQLQKDPADAYFDGVSQVDSPRWSSGRIVLLGDAAWCVTLFAGHGAALALAGADQLGTALRRHGDDIPAALAEWETGLRPEVVKRQALARRGMYQYAPPSRFHVWMNDSTIRAVTLPGVRGLVRRGSNGRTAEWCPVSARSPQPA